MMLDKILIDFGIAGLSEAETDALNRAWHRLQPWPDAVAGLTRLKKKFIIAPLSNGNIALMTDWPDMRGCRGIASWEPSSSATTSPIARSTSPPRIFSTSSRADVMMVAAHLGDLRAAKGVGLRTAFVVRPLEYGPSRKPDLTPDASVDVSAKDFLDLAGQLGA